MISKYRDLNHFAKLSRVHPNFWMSEPDIDAWLSYAQSYMRWTKRKRNHRYIPKIIHQIWIGSKLPSELLTLSNTWRTLMPDYKYCLWTDKEIETLDFKGKSLYCSLVNPGAKSDIARYAILEQYGGLYVDTDFECIKSLDQCFDGSQFIAGHLPAPQSGKVEIANGLIACSKDNEIITAVNNIIAETTQVDEKDNMEIMRKTGPYMLTKTIENKLKNEKVGILPSNYFYAWPNFLKELDSRPKEYLEDYSLALHYWHCSWMKQKQEKKNIIKRVYSKIKNHLRTK